MKDRVKYIIGAVIIIGLFLILFFTKGKNNKEILTFGEITSTTAKNEFSAIYFSKKTDEVDKVLASMRETYGLKTYYCDTSIKDINNLLQKSNLSTETNEIYVLFANSTPVTILDNSNDFESYKTTIEKDLFKIIPESERYYKVAEDAASITKLIRSNNYTVLVFGYDSCNYCKLYLPVINKISKEYKTDIYYFNRDTYDPDEYSKVLSLDLEVPVKCTLSGEASSTTGSFPKPMTLITKNGKTVDCIRGYVEENTVLEKLKKYKLIKG